MKKRGQIALFIIVGIVVIIAVSLVVVTINRGKQSAINSQTETQTVDQDVLPVKAYVESCTKAVAREGLEIMGRNGGYIDLAHMTNIKLNPVIYNSDAIQIGEDVLPFWRSLDKKNNIVIKIPPLQKPNGLNSIEAQLEFYINAKVNSCFGFSQFRQYDVIVGKPKSEVLITTNDVIVKLDMPTIVTDVSTGKKSDIKSFSTYLSINFKQIYDFAAEIVENEANYTFIEKTVLNTISTYSDYDKNALPPVANPTKFGKGSSAVMWDERSVREKIRYDVLDFVRAIQIINTKLYVPYGGDDQLSKGMRSSYNYQFVGGKNTNLSASFLYPDSDIYFSMGQRFIKGESIVPSYLFFFKLIPGFDILRYTYHYDLSFPVIVKLGDPTAFNYQGYNFNFALEANIRNSVPINSDFNFNPSYQGYSLSIGKESQILNKTITLSVNDRHTKAVLSDAEVNYECGESAFIGITDDTGKVIENYPYCAFGGRILVRKTGYASIAVPFNNNKDDKKPLSLTAELWPKVNRTIKIQKRTVADMKSVLKVRNINISAFDDLLAKNARDLSKYDKVFFLIQRNDESDEPVPMIGFLKVEGNTSIPSIDVKEMRKQVDASQMTTQQKADYIKSIEDMARRPPSDFDTDNVREFVPGNYTISGNLLDYSGAYIGREYECKDSSGISNFLSGGCVRRTKDVQVPIEELNATGVKDLSHPYYFKIGICKPKTVLGDWLSSYADIYSYTFNMAKDSYKNAYNAIKDPIEAGKVAYNKLYDTSSFCGLEKLDPIWIPIWSAGGLDSADITITEEQLYNSKNITFYMIELEKPQDYDALKNSDQKTLSDYQNMFFVVKPKFD
jgi:hypothetical protein